MNGEGKKPKAVEAAEVEGVEKRVLASFEAKEISWQLVYQLATWTQLAESSNPAKSAVGRRHYLQAVETFSNQSGGIEVSIFSPVGGAYLMKVGDSCRSACVIPASASIGRTLAVLSSALTPWPKTRKIGGGTRRKPRGGRGGPHVFGSWW